MAKVIENRTLATKTYTAPTGAGQTGTFLNLSDISEYLTKLESCQQPKDIKVKASSLFVELKHDDYMRAQSMTQGGPEDQFFFTKHGAKLLSNLVLPGHFFKGLRQLAFMDASGAEIATKAFGKFAAQREEQVMIRTINTRHPDKFQTVVRAIRSCHSTQYAPYSNRLLCKDLTEAITKAGISFPGDVPSEKGSTSYAVMPVLGWNLTDERMRLRFCGVDPAHAAFAAVLSAGSPYMDGEPMPVFEIHNSEVGMRRVVVRAGVFLADKGVFIGAYGLGAENTWTHRGNINRIRGEMKLAVENILAEAHAVCEAYRDAEDIEVEDAYTFLNKQIEGQVPKALATKITETLASQVAVKNLSPTSATAQPGSALQAALSNLKTATLAEICTAVATVAKDATDLSAQYDLEKLSATILHRGLKIAGEAQ